MGHFDILGHRSLEPALGVDIFIIDILGVWIVCYFFSCFFLSFFFQTPSWHGRSCIVKAKISCNWPCNCFYINHIPL